MTKLPLIPALLGAALTGCHAVYTPANASATDAEVDTDDDAPATTSTGGRPHDVDKRPAAPATTATSEGSTSAAGGTEGGSGTTSGDATSITTADDAPATTTAADSTTGDAATVTTGTDTAGDSTPGDGVATDTTGTTGEDAATYGKCGWHSEKYYYACEKAGGSPGEAAPNDFKPIDCPMNLVAGNDCTEEMGPITNVGCCMPNGDLLYCEIVEMNKIVQIDCDN